MRDAADRTRRLLLALPQSLFDLGSGAAVSMRLLACQLARSGWQVQALCTSATESGRLGLPPEGARWPMASRRRLPPDAPGAPPRWAIQDSGVAFEVLALPEGTRQDWARLAGAAYEHRLNALLRDFKPAVLLTFGAEAQDHRIAAAARASGCAVVLALHNLAYLGLSLPPHDALLLPSAYMAGRYAGATAQPIGILSPPLWDADSAVAAHDPVFFTFFNPEPAKGAELVVRLAAALPALPFMVVAGRAGGPQFAAMARLLGHDPARLHNVTVSAGGVPVRELLALTRAVLMPSLVEEAAGRVAAEALANGIPVLVSDSGALPDTVTPGGQVLPLLRGAGGALQVDEAGVARWAAALQALADDEIWHQASARAQEARARWSVAHQAAQANAWFSQVADAAGARAGGASA